VLIGVVGVCALVGHQTLAAAQGQSNTLEQVSANRWFFDRSASSVIPFMNRPISLDFEKSGVVSGSGPCNTYRGTFSVDGSTIQIGPLDQSYRACDPQYLTAEGEYLRALQTVSHVDTSRNDQLELTGGSNLRLTYQSAPTTQAAGDDWVTNPFIWLGIALGLCVVFVGIYLLIRRPWARPH
jgi:heat shock protein HslJ